MLACNLRIKKLENNRCTDQPTHPAVQTADSQADLFVCLLKTSFLMLMNQLEMSRVMRKPTFWFLTMSDTNQAVQPQKIARGLKFRI